MSARKLLLTLVVVAVIVFGFIYLRPAPEKPAPPPPAKPIGAAIVIQAPLGLPPVPVPEDNPPTADSIALGRRLYYDPMLSVDNNVSCATCHHPDTGFCDGKQVSNGFQGKQGARNSPTVFNAAYFATQFWDGRAPSLEKQAEGPVQNPVEMAHTLDGAVQRLMADTSYRVEFQQAFGSDQITFDMVEKAIASFERTVVSADSPFDRFHFGGDKKALSPAAQRGLRIFLDPKKGNCNVCHKIDENYALFTDNKFHNIGVGLDSKGELIDVGRYAVTHDETDKGRFKTPSLRNIALTAPYMHDGSIKTLKDVVDFYVGGGRSNAHLDPEMKPLDFLTFQERADLLAFLESLTGAMPPSVGPPDKTGRRTPPARAGN